MLAIPTVHFTLAYVDELLMCFSTHPQKSIQKVFQRIIALSGTEQMEISQHIANTILDAVGCGIKVAASKNILNESDAIQLYKLIVKYAIEEANERNIKDKTGASWIFHYMCDRLSSHLSEPHQCRGFLKANRRTVQINAVQVAENVCRNDCIQLVAMEDAYVTTTIASCLDVEDSEMAAQVQKLYDEGLASMLEEYQQKATRFPIRSEYFSYIFERFLTTDMQNVCTLTMCKFINSVVNDVSRDPKSGRSPLHPIIFNIFARSRSRNVDLHFSFDGILRHATNVMKKGSPELFDTESLLCAFHDNWLATVLLGNSSDTSTYEGCLETLEKVPRIYINPISVANALIAFGEATERVWHRTSQDQFYGQLPWDAECIAKALDDFLKMTPVKWKEIIDELDQPAFRIRSIASARFIFNFFNKLEIDILNYFLYKKFDHPDGQIDFYALILTKGNGKIHVAETQKVVLDPIYYSNFSNSTIINNVKCITFIEHLIELDQRIGSKRIEGIFEMISIDAKINFSFIFSAFHSKNCNDMAIKYISKSILHLFPHFHILPGVLIYLLKPNAEAIPNLALSGRVRARFVSDLAQIIHANWRVPEIIDDTVRLLFGVDADLLKDVLLDPHVRTTASLVHSADKFGFYKLEKWIEDSLKINEMSTYEFLKELVEDPTNLHWIKPETIERCVEFVKSHKNFSILEEDESKSQQMENLEEITTHESYGDEETGETEIEQLYEEGEDETEEDELGEEAEEEETEASCSMNVSQIKNEESDEENEQLSQNEVRDKAVLGMDKGETESDRKSNQIDKSQEEDLVPFYDDSEEADSPVELSTQLALEPEPTEIQSSYRDFDLLSRKIVPPPGFKNQDLVMRESGRNSSTGRTPQSSYSQNSSSMQRGFGNNSQPPFNPMNNYIQQQPTQQNPANVGATFNTSNFGGSQELIRPPGTGAFGSNSPTNNQARPGMPPAPQRQNSASSWNFPGSVQRSTGPPTPLQFDLRAQIPNPLQQEFQPRPANNAIFEGDLSQITFAEDVQEEANSFFEAIYTHKSHVMSVPALIEKLKSFKNSTDVRDHKLLVCVVKNLFEEYKFFNDYPDRELKITAELYGGIIREGIINESSNLHFATAVRKVIESLSQQPSTNLFTFGLVALEFCRTKLCTYPKVCSMISGLDNFVKFPQSIRDYVLAGMTGDIARVQELGGRNTPPVWTAPRVTDNRAGSGIAVPQNRTGNNVLSYTNVDTLVKATESEGAEVAQPAEVIVDKMSFLFNNLSQTNMGAKKEEVLGLIADHGEPFIKWLAQYIVMKRVSIEQNFQPLYNTFVQVLDHPLLDQYIKKETFRNIRILLRSDKRQAASNYSDRQLLKNLGMWLGSITIARSKPILLNELDLKSLLLEAYYKGQQELLFVVPFIAKILLSCSKSPIFNPSCAWIKSILKVLAELHNEPDLKINLKFEIEVLCKELSVELPSLPIDGILKETEKLIKVKEQLSEIKMLAPPNQFIGSSPVPRPGTETAQAPGNDTKPSTPLPEGENGNGPEAPAQSHFAYSDINVISYEGLAPHMQIKSNLPLFQLHPQLKQVVRPSLTVAIKELIGPVAERAQKIAMTVTESLIKKDFSMDPNEKNLKTSSFHMMRAMTAGMAMITCRDPLSVTMANSLQNAFQNALRNSVAPADSAKMIEEAAQVITQENVELATNFIVKTACEKAASEMEKRLEPEFQKRIAARQAGKQYVDEAAQAMQNVLPDQISFQAGETPKELLDIYMQFSTRICGFKPSASEDMSPDASRPIVLTDERTSDHLSGQLNMIIKEVDNTMSAQPNLGNKAYNAVGIIRDLLHQLAMNPRDNVALGKIIGQSVEHFLHAFHVDPNTKNPLDVEWPRRLRDLFIGVTRLCLNLTAITEIARKITNTIINLNVDYKWNVEGVEVLFKHSLIQPIIFDQHVASKMQSGPSVDQATFFAQRLYRALSNGDNKVQFQTVFPSICEQLMKISQMMPGRIPGPGEASNSPLLEDGEHELSTKVVESVLREWITMCYTPAAQRNPQEALSNMIHVMHEHGCLSTDDKVSSFFKMCTEMCVDVTNKMLRNDNGQSAHQSTIIRQRCYYTLDAYVKLVSLMIKYSDGGAQTQTKITLLKKILSTISNVLIVDHEMRAKDFNALPYHRILITLFNELTAPDGTALDQLQWSVLEAFGQALFTLQPRRVPGFGFAWLDIVGHRNVIGKLLGGSSDNSETIKMSAMYTQLIICHLKFLAPFLRNLQLPKSISMLYKGTLRVLLVILHDFPELLCEFHYVICDTIPANCVQLRNLVLSAYPRNMRLPDPFALQFKAVDSIPDMAQEPKSNLNMTTIIPDQIRLALDDYLANRTNVDFLTALPNLLQTSQSPGQKYNTTVLNAVVLYVGIKAIENLYQRRMHINIQSIAHTSYMDVFQNLAVQLCTEGRYLLFNAIANQLRYPNAHTHYFSCVFLFLFLNSDYDAIQEQITRILFERLVALRPHPWGLLITFIELIKNPVYNFWKFEFTRCAPEIERLFQNVANTCVPSSRPVTETTSRA